MFTLRHISKAFGIKDVLSNISFSIGNHEVVGLVGKNGSGKSTLLKILAGYERPDTGVVEIGSNIQIGYFSQEVSHLQSSNSGFEELENSGATRQECYKYGKFLHLTPEDLAKPVSTLSRRQKTKLEFIKLLMQQNNLLILDEPTNHLEIDTREEIEEALRQFQGTILIASHDRYFLEIIGIDRQLKLDNGKLEEVFDLNL